MRCFQVLIIVLFILFLGSSCSQKKNDVNTIDDTMLPFLKEIKVDTFNLDSISYYGVVYLFARSINDSVLIHFMPAQCIFFREHLTYSFEYMEKLFLCQGNINIFESLITFGKDKTVELNQKWRLCNDIGPLDIYDPKDISVLLIKDQLIKVSLSQTTITKIVFGNKFPPLPRDQCH